MTQDDRMETITDPAAIRATDDPDERGDFPCCTTPAAVALDLDAIEARANAATDGPWRHGNWSDHLGDRRVISGGDGCYEVERLDIMRAHDAEFIAHARGDVPALVAEVRRLAALCIPLTDLAQELDMARQNLHHSRAMSSAHFERAERENARAESAEAEVVTLRARLARSRSRYCGCGWCCSNNADGVVPGDAHLICSRYRAALAVTTGEGQ